MLHISQHLTHAVTGTLPPRRRNRFELSDELIDALSDEPRLIVVDEAQWLNRECIEYLRHLHDFKLIGSRVSAPSRPNRG